MRAIRQIPSAGAAILVIGEIANLLARALLGVGFAYPDWMDWMQIVFCWSIMLALPVACAMWEPAIRDTTNGRPPPMWQCVTAALAALISALACAVMAFVAFERLRSIAASGLTMISGLPLWPVDLSFVIGFMLAGLVTGWVAVARFSGRAARPGAQP
jgi:hypothetical protein